MPPKRKRADDAATTATAARTTRSSARTKNAAAAEARGASVASEDSASKQSVPGSVDGVAEPPAKKSRASKASTARAKGRGKSHANEDAAPSQDASPSEASSSKVPVKSSKVPEPYSTASAASLFSVYADEDDPNVIGPEGFERLCTDMDISLEGALPLILAWQLNASEMAKITKDEWSKGMEELQIANTEVLAVALRDLEGVLLLDKPPVKPPAHAKKGVKTVGPPEPYNRAQYRKYALDPKKAYSQLYAYCFNLAKPAGSRNIDMETASAFWSVLVLPKYPIMAEILGFINEKGTYKAVNKDLWSMTLEFCTVTDPNLSNYDPDGAWPSMIDNFVEWKQNNDPSAGTTANADE